MREIAVDTETTGLDPLAGDRIVEIGCVELVNKVPTGKVFHRYVNPEREMSKDAFRVHGLDDGFLAGQPTFAQIADELLAFLEEAPLVIHNAEFDIRFLNAELERLRYPILPPSRAVDTLQLVRRRFPGAQATLDVLCRRFGIDNSARTKHGALLDAELLAEVYLELSGGRQPGLALVDQEQAVAAVMRAPRPVRPPRPHAPTAAELEAHAALVGQLKDPIWALVLAEDAPADPESATA